MINSFVVVKAQCRIKNSWGTTMPVPFGLMEAFLNTLWRLYGNKSLNQKLWGLCKRVNKYSAILTIRLWKDCHIPRG